MRKLTILLLATAALRPAWGAEEKDDYNPNTPFGIMAAPHEVTRRVCADFHPEGQAFTMIGDSRTAHIAGVIDQKEYWEDDNYLKMRRSEGEIRWRIHNIAIAGSTAAEWVHLLFYGIVPMDCVNQRVVLMIGGNDILLARKNWEGLPGFVARPAMKRKVESIHRDVLTIVHMLRFAGKEVVVPPHPTPVNCIHAWWGA